MELTALRYYSRLYAKTEFEFFGGHSEVVESGLAHDFFLDHFS